MRVRPDRTDNPTVGRRSSRNCGHDASPRWAYDFVIPVELDSSSPYLILRVRVVLLQPCTA